MTSPYDDKSTDKWIDITQGLIDAHPLSADEIVEVTLGAWNDIFQTRMGGKYLVGTDVSISPQMMGNYIHELVPLEFHSRYPEVWRKEQEKKEKDLVHIPDRRFSVEIKTSSSAKQIFGNRSYAQPAADGDLGRKGKFGYYLAVNFEKWVRGGPLPSIRLIRFGWLDHTDWIAQKAATGQSARLDPDSDKFKLLVLYKQ